MANITIPNLPQAVSIDGSEQLLGVQSGTSKSITTGQIVSLANGQGGNLPFPVSIGGTGNTTFTANGVIYGNTTNALGVTAAGTTGQVLIATTSGAPSWSASPTLTTSLTTPLLIGGTAASSSLTLQSTSGVGTSDSLVFKTGSQVQAMTIGTAQTVKIGTGVAAANANLYLTKEMTGSTTAYGILSSGVVQSDVTSAAYGSLDQIGTEAASFTLGSLQHYAAFQGTIGIGSQVTNQYGFNATQNLIGAVNNYGFISALPSVTTATISNVALTSNVVTITTSAAHGYGKGQSVIVVATTNTAVNGTYTITSVPSTTTFTYALVSADIVSTADTGTAYVNTGRYNYYAAGTAPNLFNGQVQVGLGNNTGGAALSASNPAFFKAGAAATYTDIVSSGTVSNAFSSSFTGGTFAARLATTYTNATTVYINAAPTAGTNVTITNPYALYSAAGANYFGGTVTSATSTTTPLLIGGTGAASTLTLQSTSGVGTTDSIAFKVGNNGATTGGTIGTTGNWGFGGNATTFIGLAVPLDITGATSAYGQRINGNVQSGVTTLAAAYFSNIALENASFTTTDLVHFLANPPSGGAGSTATNQYGFKANSTLGSNGAATVTNSYGFYSDLASASNKWNFYANGTAPNYFNGAVTLGTPLAVSSGGTGATTSNAALTNLTTFTSTATASGTTVLTNTSTYFQFFTGTLTQTITLPVTSTLGTGWSFHIVNNSTGNLTVNSSGGNLVITVLPGLTVMCTCIGTALTTAADWEAGYTDFTTATGTGSVVLSASPTLTGTTTATTLSATTLTATAGAGFQNMDVLTSGASWSLPAALQVTGAKFKITVIGGGGGGGGNPATAATSGAGGGGGGLCVAYLNYVSGQNSVTTSFGAAGAGASNTAGTAGGATTATYNGLTYIGTGGSGGAIGATAAGGAGGTGTTGTGTETLALSGQNGGNAGTTTAVAGVTYLDNSGGGTGLGWGNGGRMPFAGATGSAGNAATGYGGGGSGSTAGSTATARAGGAGQNGAIIIEY